MLSTLVAELEATPRGELPASNYSQTALSVGVRHGKIRVMQAGATGQWVVRLQKPPAP